LWGAVENARNLLAGFESAARVIEDSRDYTAEAKRRLLLELAGKAVAELKSYAPLAAARKWTEQGIKHIEQRIELPPLPSDPFALQIMAATSNTSKQRRARQIS
jgi:hypothetical protein